MPSASSVMSVRAHLLLSVAVFSMFGLAGPIIRAISFPSTNFLFTIWPALVLGSGGTAASLERDLKMAAIVNVVFFALVGFLVGSAIRRRPTMLVSAYAMTCVVVAVAQAWGAGFNVAFFSWKELAFALALYGLAFSIVWWSDQRFVSNDGRPSHMA